MDLSAFIYQLFFFGIELLKMYLFCFPLFQQHAKPPKFTVPAVVVSHLVYAALAVEFSSKASLIVWIMTSLCCFLISTTKLSKSLSLLAYPVISVLDMTAVLPFLFLYGYTAEDLEANALLELLADMLSIPLLLLLGLIVRIAASKRRHVQIRGKLILPVILFLFAIGALETAAFTIVTVLPENIRLIVLFSLIAANVLSLVLCVLLMRSDSNNLLLTQESQIMQKQMEMQQQHYQRIMEKSEELRSFRHDIRNHIYCMRVLLDEGKTDELKSYMDSMDIMVHSVGHGVKSGNKLLDAILGELVQKYSDVKLILNGSYPEHSVLSDVDFCTIFFNALSNAFEAAAQTEEKKVEISVRTLETHLLFTVSNSASAAPQMRHNRYISTKKEAGHGYGMSNMIDCLNRNQMQYDTEFADGIFTLNIYFLDALAPFAAKN